jgi:Ca-activated chloride channel family protein
LLIVATLLQGSAPVLAGQAADLVLILDASGSMWARVDGNFKIAIAREVLGDMIDKLPDDSTVGMVAYGHRRKRDCSDIETLVPIGPLDKAALTQTIKGLDPRGRTPITASINQAIDLVRATQNPARVILVSDGLETCGGNPCKAVADARAAGVDFVMHVVGFALGDKNVASLECAAQAGGGLYFDAANAGELGAALEQAVEKTPLLSGGQLSVKAIANDGLADVAIYVIDSATGEKVATGRTYQGPETNPRLFRLPPGRYQADVTALKFKGDTKRTLEDLEIVEGEVLERSVDFRSGQLSVKVLVNGEPGDAGVQVTRVDDGAAVAQGRTYTGPESNPQIFNLTPGSYDISVKPVTFRSGEERQLQGVEVRAGEMLARTVEYGTGTLSIVVTENGALADTGVTVYDTKTGRPVAQGRTYTGPDSNPKVFELLAGRYDIELKPLKITGNPPQRFEAIDIGVNQRAERAHDYRTGTLKIATLLNGEPVDATIAVVDGATGTVIANNRSYGKPREYSLLPGEYRVRTKAIKVEGNPKREVGVSVSVGALTERGIDLAVEGE